MFKFIPKFLNSKFPKIYYSTEIAESTECTNCDRRERHDACHTLFECSAFQQYQEDAITTLQKKGEQPPTTDSLAPIMLKSTDGWDQVAFVTLKICGKMEIVWEQQRQPIVAATQHIMPDLTVLLLFAVSNPATEEKDDPG